MGNNSGRRILPVDENNSGYRRRDFVKLTGALGLGAVLAPSGCAHTPGDTTVANPNTSPNQSPKPSNAQAQSGDGDAMDHAAEPGTEPGKHRPRVPRRPFGRTGQEVSILALGGYFDPAGNAALIERAADLGITFWETTLRYGGKGYGDYFRRHPAMRSEIFVLGKTRGGSHADMDRDLATVLADTGSEYIDFFTIHGLKDPALLSTEVMRWVERAKASGRIRYFGFSTHNNMVACLRTAAGLDWIDGVLTSYNYRLMQDPAMEDAISACADRGIAVTAIKSQGLPTNPKADLGQDSSTAQAALAQFHAAGLSPYQAKLKAVWSNPHIASICSMMLDDSTLLANASAASTPGALGGAAGAALRSLRHSAQASDGSYCTGCAEICEAQVGNVVPIAGVMRYLMYARSYGDIERARREFAALPAAVRAAIPGQDYTGAEKRCPQRMPIAQLMHEAVRELSGPSLG